MNKLTGSFIVALTLSLIPTGVFAQSTPTTISVGEPGDSSFRLGSSADYLRLEQSFTAGGGTISSFQVALSRVGSPTQVITASIKSSLTGTTFYTTTIKPSQVVSSTNASPTWITITPTTPLTMMSGVIALSVSGTNGTNYYRWRTNSMNPDSGGVFYRNEIAQSAYDGLTRATFITFGGAAAPESAQGTSITTTGTITDAAGASWTISTDRVAYKNGVATSLANVAWLYYWNHIVYAQTTNDAWWMWGNNTWQATTDPRTTTSSPAPTINFTASPASITTGQSSTLTWGSTNATSCTAGGAWTGAKAVSGTQTVAPTVTSVYTLNCSGAGGSVSASTTVAVVAFIESAQGTTIPTATTIVDASGAKWTISGGMIYKDSTSVSSADATLLLYWNHTVYGQNSSGAWYLWNNGWQATTDPRVTTPPPAPSPSPAPDFSKIGPGCFVALPDRILQMGSLFSGSTWNDPHVIKVGTQYVMYAASDLNFDGDIKVYRLVSNDGTNWALSPSTAVFQKSTDPAAWDNHAAETPAVVYFNGLYYLFYTGYNTALTDVSAYKIGYATSPDGINWTRQKMIIAPSGTNNFYQSVVGEPGPTVFNGKLYLYFTAIGPDAAIGTTLQTIGMISTSDGVNWSAPVQTLKPNQTLFPRSQGWLGYSTPHAATLGGKVHLFVDVVNEVPSWTQMKLYHAASADGVTNWAQDGGALFDRSQFTWTQSEIRSPAVYLEGNKLMMWFAGHTQTTTSLLYGIGYSACQL